VFCVRPFALHRQQPETYKQNVDDSLPLEKFLRTPITRHSRSRIFLQLWTHGRPQGGVDSEPKISRKPEVGRFQIIHLIVAVTVNLPTLTLHKNQVRCSGVMQWWDCSSFISAPLPAETDCQTC